MAHGVFLGIYYISLLLFLFHQQKDLDLVAAELAARQDRSESARKKLLDQSREFKKNVNNVS